MCDFVCRSATQDSLLRILLSTDELQVRRRFKFFKNPLNNCCILRLAARLYVLSCYYTLCQTDFQNFCTAGKCMKFATAYKPIPHYPPHLGRVATLAWKIKNSNFLQIFSRTGWKCKHIAFLSPLTLLFVHKFWYLLCIK